MTSADDKAIFAFKGFMRLLLVHVPLSTISTLTSGGMKEHRGFTAHIENEHLKAVTARCAFRSFNASKILAKQVVS